MQRDGLGVRRRAAALASGIGDDPGQSAHRVPQRSGRARRERELHGAAHVQHRAGRELQDGARHDVHGEGRRHQRGAQGQAAARQGVRYRREPGRQRRGEPHAGLAAAGLRGDGRGVHRRRAEDRRDGERDDPGTRGALGRGCAGGGGDRRDGGLHGDAQPGGVTPGDGGLCHVGRHGDGGGGLYGHERHADVRGGRELADGGGAGAGRHP